MVWHCSSCKVAWKSFTARLREAGRFSCDLRMGITHDHATTSDTKSLWITKKRGEPFFFTKKKWIHSDPHIHSEYAFHSPIGPILRKVKPPKKNTLIETPPQDPRVSLTGDLQDSAVVGTFVPSLPYQTSPQHNIGKSYKNWRNDKRHKVRWILFELDIANLFWELCHLFWLKGSCWCPVRCVQWTLWRPKEPCGQWNEQIKGSNHFSCTSCCLPQTFQLKPNSIREDISIWKYKSQQWWERSFRYHQRWKRNMFNGPWIFPSGTCSGLYLLFQDSFSLH